MEVSIRDYEEYLYDHYKKHGIDSSLFMKLVGEVAEVLNKRDGRKASDNEDLKAQLANKLLNNFFHCNLHQKNIYLKELWNNKLEPSTNL